MYWADTTILAIILIGAAFGALSGILWQVSRIVGIGVAMFSSIYFHEWASRVLAGTLFREADSRIPMALAYPIVFLSVYTVFFSATLLLEIYLKAARLQPLNRLLGAGLGALKSGLILGTVFLGMAHYPHSQTKEIMEKSVLAPALADGMTIALGAVPAEAKDDLLKGLKTLREKVRAKAGELARTSSP